jgi:hypothetical protein
MEPSNTLVAAGENKLNETKDSHYSLVDQILEKEKQTNKNDHWNKLDKTMKIQKLHAFAEKYGRQNNYPVKEIKSLKTFFIDCLDKSKLQKNKEVNYDRETKEIVSIPSLFFNTSTHHFTLKIMDMKRVSTLKSLTPKRMTEKNKETSENSLVDLAAGI